MAQFSCGIQCTRIILLILNVLFFLSGLMLLGFGIFVKVNKKFDIALSEHVNTKMFGGDVMEWVGIVMITVGAFTILLSAFGCLGAALNNRAFLYIYAVILFLMIIAELAAMIATLTARVQIRNSYEKGFRELFIEIYRNNHTDLRHIIEDMEQEFQCCGVSNVSDYTNNNFIIPATCHEGKDFYRPIFSKGCATAVVDWVWDQFPIFGGALGGVLLIEIFGVIASIVLGTAISHSSPDYLKYDY